MVLSVEAIVAIVTLVVTCPPSLFIIWKVYRRRIHRQMRTESDTAYQPDVLRAASLLSPRGHLIHFLSTEQRLEARVISFHGQFCTFSCRMICFFLGMLIDKCDRHDPGNRYGRLRVTLMAIDEK